MRYILLFILISFSCSAQDIKDNTKVTAYTLGVMFRNGSCTIKDYLKDVSAVGTTVQATVSYDSDLAHQLLQLKRDAKENWAAEECDCKGQVYKKGQVIPNMYVVQINSYRDTIYTTKNNCAIFFPEQQKKYFDAESKLENVLNKGFGDFVTKDFLTDIMQRVYDSVSVKKVVINNKPIYKLKRKSFEDKIIPFQMVRTDSIFGKRIVVAKEYWVNNLEVLFGDTDVISTINAHHPTGKYGVNLTMTVDGIAIGDSEEKIIENYPCSTTFRNWGAPLKDPTDNYYYQISFTDNKGFAFIYIWEKKVYAVEVTFF
ncbi:hypothetical protein DVK85_06065 [Flavobacterium arcticum]|uniref:Uncharacterized protein n=1 Tax=Flavobacterium arcticum TaxID=1784713 RepID=A0A345HB65_9FLAO|nr:hypothetical protein [Flavobacterium arcticum]AXG73825.1 hypothetical protein DVK85_06065 [Flavobacterium arcticum]KAF2511777.1 hypothetical protein E0W72_05580 [Flavobacterium arcticum]